MGYRTHAILAAVVVTSILTGFYWWIHRDSASAGSAASETPLNVPTPLPPAPVGEPLWRKQLRDEVLAFAWTESIGGEDAPHHGGVLFVERGGRLYSRAWYGQAEFTQSWPAVEGVGALAHNTLSIAYRSSSYEADHEFYYADCHFGISPDGRVFQCRFEQLAGMNDDTLSPGAATGKRVLKMDERFQQELDLLWAFVERVQNAGLEQHGMPHCLVLPHKHADPSITLQYKGVQYGFCCDACRRVFLADPQPFIDAHRPPDTPPLPPPPPGAGE